MAQNKKEMDEQENQALKQRVRLLLDEVKAGRVYFSTQVPQTAESIKKVRLNSDGSVDLNTVDGLVRAAALAASYVKTQRELKEIPLRKTQEGYFALLEQLFSKPYSEMLKHQINPHQIASDMANRKNIVEAMAHDTDELHRTVLEFWEAAAPVIEAHLSSLNRLRGVYGGDIFPSYQQNIAIETGLYLDTVVVPDPLLRVLSLRSTFRPERYTYLLVKHALSALRYKTLALAEVDPPIVVVAPDFFHLEESVRKFITFQGEQDLLFHAERLFGMKFGTEADLTKFLGTIRSKKQLAQLVKEPDRFLLDVEWQHLPIPERIEKHREMMGENLGEKIRLSDFSMEFRLMFGGRMMQISDAVFKAGRLGGTVLMDAPTSWRYLAWKYQDQHLITQKVDPSASPDFIANALAVSGSDIMVISNLPEKDLIALRKEGALGELRELMSKGINEIQQASEHDFKKIAEQISSNMAAALASHSQELKTFMGGTKKFFGVKVAPFIGYASLALAAAASGNVGLSVLAAGLGLVGLPSAKDVSSKAMELLKERKKLVRSPVGMLFRASQKAGTTRSSL